MQDSHEREFIEESPTDMVNMMVARDNARGVVGYAIGESLRRSLKDRRVLVVAADAPLGDKVEAAFREAGVPVQRATPCNPIATISEKGQPTTRRGEIVVIDGGAFDTILSERTAAMRDTTAAIMAIVAETRVGSVEDHVMMATPEEAMLDALHVLNKLMDRMVEADLVQEMGGVDRVPPRIRQFMNWLPGSPKRETRAVSLAQQMVGRQPRRLERLDMETTDGTLDMDQIEVVYDRTTDYDQVCGRGDRARLSDMSDAAMESLFGDEAMEREYAARRTYVLRAEPSLGRDLGRAMVAGLLEPAGFDHRSQNDAWNRRQGRGSHGDRRMNRGGKGRR